MEPAIIVAIIGAAVSLGGSVLLYFTARSKNSKDFRLAQNDAKARLDARIDERVTEQIEAAWRQVDSLIAERDGLVAKVREQDKKIAEQDEKIAEQAQEIAELREHMAASEQRETEMFGHIQAMADHIFEGKPPPPPTMPTNLVKHFSK